MSSDLLGGAICTDVLCAVRVRMCARARGRMPYNSSPLGERAHIPSRSVGPRGQGPMVASRGTTQAWKAGELSHGSTKRRSGEIPAAPSRSTCTSKRTPSPDTPARILPQVPSVAVCNRAGYHARPSCITIKARTGYAGSALRHKLLRPPHSDSLNIKR